MIGFYVGYMLCWVNNIGMYFEDCDVMVVEVLKDWGYWMGICGKWGLGFEGSLGYFYC